MLERYGAEPGKTSYANNCLVARRLAERGVRFIQLYHWGWDSHGTPTDEGLNVGLVKRCQETDQPTAALLADLKARGLLEDTLVVWGGEFGRTPMRENRGGQEMKFIGRDHHPVRLHHLDGGRRHQSRASAMARPTRWAMRSSRIRWRCATCTPPCCICWASTTASCNYPYQGLDQKLTGVKPARIVSEILA